MKIVILYNHFHTETMNREKLRIEILRHMKRIGEIPPNKPPYNYPCLYRKNYRLFCDAELPGIQEYDMEEVTRDALHCGLITATYTKKVLKYSNHGKRKERTS